MDNILKVLMTLDSKQLVQGLKTASGRLKGFDQTLKSTGRSLTTKVSAPLAALGGLALKQSMNFQKLRMSLETLAGGAEEGGAAFEKLVQFSAKTPFQLNELVRVNNMLMGFGLNTEQARESLKLLGDVAAVSGGNLTGMGVAFGQSAAEGRIMTRDLLQFINNGVPMLKLLAEELGTTTTRVREMASEGKLSFPLVVRALERATSAGGMFENGMEKLSKTMAGTFSNIKDNLTIALATLGDQMVETFDVEQLGKDFVQFIKDITTSFKEMEPATRDLVVQMGAFAATAGPLIYLAGSVIPKLVKSIRLLIANPIIAGLYAVTGALVLLIDRVNEIEDVQEKAKVAQEGIKKFTAELNKVKQSEDYLSGSEDALIKYHEINLKLQKSIKANAEAQIEFAKDLGNDGVNAVKQYSDQLSMAEGNIAVSEAALKSFNKTINKGEQGLKDITYQADKANEELQLKDVAITYSNGGKIKKGLEKTFSSVFGNDTAINDLKALSFDPDSVEVAEEILPNEQLDQLAKRVQMFKQLMEGIPETVERNIEQGLFDLGVVIGESLSSGGNILQTVGASMVNTIANLAISLGKLAISIGVTVEGIKQALKSLNPVAAIAAGVALIAAGTFFKSQASNIAGGATPFANGGIVSGPTLGLIGEYSGARSNPEVVAPLDKLKGMIGQSGQNVNVGGEFRIQGQDLVVALQRAERNRKRIL